MLKKYDYKSVGHTGEPWSIIFKGIIHGCLHVWRIRDRYWGNGVCNECHDNFHDGKMNKFQRKFFYIGTKGK